MKLKKLIRNIFNFAGFDVIRLKNSPQVTLLGLRSRRINTVIDVGANEGQFGRLILGVFPKAHLYCFEPLDEPFQKLVAWANKIGDQIRCYNLAVGDKEGIVEMHSHIEHSPSSSFLLTTSHCQKIYPQTNSQVIKNVTMKTLEGALSGEMQKMTQGVLLKIDVQGFEDRVLRGAQSILKICEVCLLEVSLDKLYEHQADFFELNGLLHEFNLHYAGNLDQVYGNDGRVIYFDAVFLRG